MDGELAVIGDNTTILGVEGFRALPGLTAGSASYLTQIIESIQYVKASWDNELGLGSNYNMKREAIMSQEAQLGAPSLLPLPLNMLNRRKIMCDEHNKKYGTSWSVRFSSSWIQTADDVNVDPAGEPEPKEETEPAPGSEPPAGKEGEPDE